MAIGTKAVRISTIRAAPIRYPQYPRNLPPRYQSQLPPQYYDRHRGFERRDHWRQEHRHQRPHVIRDGRDYRLRPHYERDGRYQQYRR